MIAGIDGGGTSTKLELRDENNRPVQRLTFGPFNVSAVGVEGVRSVLADMAQAADTAHMERLCIGGAGASFTGLETLIREELGRYGFAGRLMLCTDFEIALRGAIEGAGGILIAGTGSVAFGKDGKGKAVRVGGWGNLIDDEGSGYAIGRDALAAAVRTGDGRLHAEALRAAVLKQIGGTDTASILDYVYYSGRDKSAVAALAPCVLQGAQEGDAACWAILQKNAQELACLARALGEQLGMERPRIALLGGLLAHDTPYARVARKALELVCQTVLPEHDALWGAAQLAWEME